MEKWGKKENSESFFHLALADSLHYSLPGSQHVNCWLFQFQQPLI